MSVLGTRSHAEATDLPPLVAAAVRLAEELGFENSCRVEHGRLLHALAAGAESRIGETGTGCGVGLAWMLTGRRPGVEVVSVERDPERAARVRELFADVPDLQIVTGDWTTIADHGPYDVLVLDGGGKAGPEQVQDMVAPRGTIIIDDFTPATTWPPLHDGASDEARLQWFRHPGLHTTEVRLAPDLATVIATRF